MSKDPLAQKKIQEVQIPTDPPAEVEEDSIVVGSKRRHPLKIWFRDKSLYQRGGSWLLGVEVKVSRRSFASKEYKNLWLLGWWDDDGAYPDTYSDIVLGKKYHYERITEQAKGYFTRVFHAKVTHGDGGEVLGRGVTTISFPVP